MLSKEECLKKAKELSYGWHIGDNEFVPLKDVNKLIREIYSIKPYKFEDLKEVMWVYDSKENWIRNVVILFKPCKQYPKGSFKAWADSCEETLDFVEFEENRFYPVQMANVRCERC